MPSCSCDSQRRFLDEFLAVFLREGVLGTLRSIRCSLEKSGHDFNEPLVSGSHRPSQPSAFGRSSRIFGVKVRSDPEVDSDCTRDKVFAWRWRRVGFFALSRFFAPRPVERRVPGLLRHFSPSKANSSWSSRAPGCRGRQESNS